MNESAAGLSNAVMNTAPAQSEPWSRPEHVPGPGVCYIRGARAEVSWSLILSAGTGGIRVSGDSQSGTAFIPYEELSEYRYSTDRITFHPCTVPVAGKQEEAAADIAPGHNPDRLSIAQVGEGWRLLEKYEVAYDFGNSVAGIEGWLRSIGAWNGNDWSGCDKKLTYRTRLTRAQLRAARGLPEEAKPDPVVQMVAETAWPLPDQPTTAPGDADRAWAILNELHNLGWSVAVHNDYYLKGERFTFWLLTNKDGTWVKGEANTDDEALRRARESARERTKASAEVWTEDEIRKRFEATVTGYYLEKNEQGEYKIATTRIAYKGFLAGVRAAQSPAGGTK